MLLAAIGGARRLTRTRIFPLAMATKAAINAARAAMLTVDHHHRALCSWCLTVHLPRSHLGGGIEMIGLDSMVCTGGAVPPRSAMLSHSSASPRMSEEG